MHLLTYTTILLAPFVFAVPSPARPRTANTCFDNNTGVCVGHQSDLASATAAIKSACAQVTSCSPGVTNHGRYTMTGKSSMYTATLFIGDECAGVAGWSVDACFGLFATFINARCEEQWPSGKNGTFQLGYLGAPCDQSRLSFNFGG